MFDEPFSEYSRQDTSCTITNSTGESQEAEDLIMNLIDYTQRCFVEVGLRNGERLKFPYWTTAREFMQLWRYTPHKKKLVLIPKKGTFIEINRRDAMFVQATDNA